MKKWEYKVAYLAHRGHQCGYVPGTNFDKMLWECDLEKTLNELGSEGWELVSFPHDILDDHPDGFALFRRLKEECPSVL